MNDEELLQQQVIMTTQNSQIGQTVWVYRGSMWAYPWYTSVRTIMEDPAYVDWFTSFTPGGSKPGGGWYSDPCDENNRTLCSQLYHNQEQSPGYPHGDGDCDAPTCDCGKVPCGFYFFNHSSTTVVNGQTFGQWFKDTYIFDFQGKSPLVSGFYFDECVKGRLKPPPPPILTHSHTLLHNSYITNTSFGDPWPHMAEDMGITPAIQAQLAADYTKNMAAVYDEVLARGMFSWQQLWNGQGSPSEKNGCCISPLVRSGATCATKLRSLCTKDSPAQTRAMAYAFSPGGCQGDPGKLESPLQDIANFLLVRGPYAWLGHGWLGCSRDYEVVDQLNWDYGEPQGLCAETAPNSGVFTREWTKATVSMDCNTWTPTIKMK